MVVGIEKAVSAANSVVSSAKKTPTAVSSDWSSTWLGFGDPTMYQPYWRRMGDKCRVVIPGHDLMSYFSDPGNLCWFLMPELDDAIRRLHRVVGNAVVDDDRYVIVGTGSTQLFQAVLYALSTPHNPDTEHSVRILRDGVSSIGAVQMGGRCVHIQRWSYVECVTSPNNPDGTIREAVVNRKLRAAKILDVIAEDCSNSGPDKEETSLNTVIFSCPNDGKSFGSLCMVETKDGLNCDNLLREHKIVTRGGTNFGVDSDILGLAC
ncbi:L-tryptophan--pyruvate aminotransferase 1 [Hibiscus syriacus]|uniref:L-tryptophan--pyruvate aminotransferase 1 n=1 Tax=Hibiscus syriacus TaxID=106335 RepID=A0A6A3ARF1_HIBSY|nr:L-tryptophan--pyruvate aminotransferase 1 [Hibiscus syriacus]